MSNKQTAWLQLTERAKWYELPQQSVGIGAVLGLTVACLGLLVMFLQFYLHFPMLIFWWGLTAFLIGSAGFAYSERSQIIRNQWKAQREYLTAARGATHRCIHLEGELPTHLRDSRQAKCTYFDKSFHAAPLCVYCDSYSPAIKPAENPAPQAAEAGPSYAAQA